MVGKRKRIDADTITKKSEADIDTKMKEVTMGFKKKKFLNQFLVFPFWILRTISCCFISCLRTEQYLIMISRLGIFIPYLNFWTCLMIKKGSQCVYCFLVLKVLLRVCSPVNWGVGRETECFRKFTPLLFKVDPTWDLSPVTCIRVGQLCKG